MKTRLLRLVAPKVIDALEFYAEHTDTAFRGTTGRWTDYERFPQPRMSAHGEPSMWDNGQIAREALRSINAR